MIRHRVREHVRRKAPVRSYVRGIGSRVISFKGTYSGNPHLQFASKQSTTKTYFFSNRDTGEERTIAAKSEREARKIAGIEGNSWELEFVSEPSKGIVRHKIFGRPILGIRQHERDRNKPPFKEVGGYHSKFRHQGIYTSQPHRIYE